MSPLEIQILLHYATSDTDFRNGDLSAPAVEEAIDRFVNMGLLFVSPRNDVRYEGEKLPLNMYVLALREVPHPIRKWVMPS